MGAYLDRLNAQYDEIREGIDALVNRAADESRDVTDTEQEQVNRDQERLGQLQTAIQHYSDIEKNAAKVDELRRSVPASAPAVTRAGQPEPETYDVAREFPTIGDYVTTVHRAMVRREPDAIAKIERATAHQMLADNPGIVPRPVLGPVINLLDAGRPFINSITRKPLPAGTFDRPHVSQHVAVGKQAAEKTLTESQKLIIGKLPVQASTYAGHLNISRQDIKWTSPGIMQIVFDDFAAIYAQVTDADAGAEFIASLTNTPVAVPTLDADGIYGAIFGASAAGLSAFNVQPDTVWVSPDVWGRLGGVSNGYGAPLFPLSPSNTNGAPMGLRMVVDGNFPNDTMVLGNSRFAEWYEDVDGLMQVGEPDVLGQLVGYAGYGAFLNTAPELFTPMTLPAAV